MCPTKMDRGQKGMQKSQEHGQVLHPLRLATNIGEEEVEVFNRMPKKMFLDDESSSERESDINLSLFTSVFHFVLLSI